MDQGISLVPEMAAKGDRSQAGAVPVGQRREAGADVGDDLAPAPVSEPVGEGAD